MAADIRRIAVNTGGGDAPGLNAVIRSVVLAANRLGWEVYGIEDGYDGLFRLEGIVRLDRKTVRGITHLGGTILGTTNRGNPLRWPVERGDGEVELVDRSQDVVDRLHEYDIDALVAIGGDGSLAIAHELAHKGLNVVGVPKTIDNDLAATTLTFGFMTAVETATDAIDKLHSTAEAHERVMVVELMGRHAGWIALYAGLSGTADVILLPEIPYDLETVCDKVQGRYDEGRQFAIVVVSEGAYPRGGAPLFKQKGNGQRRLGGVAQVLAEQIQEHTGRETRELVLGHLQRGGAPNAYDRLLALRFGAAAVKLVADGCFGCNGGAGSARRPSRAPRRSDRKNQDGSPRQRRDRHCPRIRDLPRGLTLSRLLRRHEDGLHPVRLRRVLGRGVAEAEPRDHDRLHPLEAGLLEQREQLSLRESASDSGGPELRIVDDVLRQLLGAHDVGDRHVPPGLQDAVQLPDHLALLEGKVDDAIGDHDVDRLVFDGDVLHPSLSALELGA